MKQEVFLDYFCWKGPSFQSLIHNNEEQSKPTVEITKVLLLTSLVLTNQAMSPKEASSPFT